MAAVPNKRLATELGSEVRTAACRPRLTLLQAIQKYN